MKKTQILWSDKNRQNWYRNDPRYKSAGRLFFFVSQLKMQFSRSGRSVRKLLYVETCSRSRMLEKLWSRLKKVGKKRKYTRWQNEMKSTSERSYLKPRRFERNYEVNHFACIPKSSVAIPHWLYSKARTTTKIQLKKLLFECSQWWYIEGARLGCNYSRFGSNYNKTVAFTKRNSFPRF